MPADHERCWVLTSLKCCRCDFSAYKGSVTQKSEWPFRRVDLWPTSSWNFLLPARAAPARPTRTSSSTPRTRPRKAGQAFTHFCCSLYLKRDSNLGLFEWAFVALTFWLDRHAFYLSGMFQKCFDPEVKTRPSSERQRSGTGPTGANDHRLDRVQGAFAGREAADESRSVVLKPELWFNLSV